MLDFIIFFYIDLNFEIKLRNMKKYNLIYYFT